MDFALWGSYHTRTAKPLRCRGLVIGPGNVLIEQELKGPPGFEHWSPSWAVFQCGMISADACLPPFLIAYHDMIKDFSITYGERCWPLLHQQDVRFRQEEMPEILYRETKKLENSMNNGTWAKGVGLDMDRPWNHCWWLLSTPEVRMWWSENFKDHAILIITGARTVSQYLAGDAKISGHASGHLPTSGGMYHMMATLEVGVSRSPPTIRSKLKICKYAKASMREAAPANLARHALAAKNTSTNAAIAIVANIVFWNARRCSRRRIRPAPLIHRHLGPRSREARAAASKAAVDGEPTTLPQCMCKRAIRFMSQICVRRNLAAQELIRAT